MQRTRLMLWGVGSAWVLYVVHTYPFPWYVMALAIVVLLSIGAGTVLRDR